LPATLLQAVTCLAFSDSGSILVTGGEDTLVNAWLLADVLDATAGQQMQVGGLKVSGERNYMPGWHGGVVMVVVVSGRLVSAAHLWPPPLPPLLLQMGGPLLQPLHSWSDHTLPVTCLALGAGDAGAVVASGSLDRSVKLRSLSGGATAGALLRSVPLPAAVHSLALDPGEHALYAGCSTGTIYDIALVASEDGSSGSSGGLLPAASGSGVAAAAAAAAGGGCPHAALEGHSRAVACLTFTPDAAHLVSGSEDGSVRMWDLRSRQQVRLLQNPVKGPVTALLALTQPPFMQVGGTRGLGRCARLLGSLFCSQVCSRLQRLPRLFCLCCCALHITRITLCCTCYCRSAAAMPPPPAAGRAASGGPSGRSRWRHSASIQMPRAHSSPGRAAWCCSTAQQR
jgi:pre-rRNA-processing protein IPI3